MSSILETPDFFKGMPDIRQEWDFLDAEDATSFTVTAISSGTNSNVATVGNGVQRLSGVATTDNTGSQMQLEGAGIDLAANNIVSCVCRQKLSSVEIEFLFGFAAIDTSLIASAPTDGIYLYKAEDNAAISLLVRRDSSEVSIPLGDLVVASTYQAWGLYIECGKNPRTARIVVYLDGDIVYDGRSDVFFNVPDDEVLALSYAMQSGSATGTQSVDIDFLRYKATRN